MGAEMLLPTKVCFCCPFDLGVRLLMTAILLLRVAGLVCGCFYGPALYLVITLGGLYIAADVLVLYVLFWRGKDGKPDCDFPNQKVWLIIWQVMNVFAIIGLIIAIVWFSLLGMWAMLHVPVHFALYIIIIILTILLIYTAIILIALFTYLKEAYIDSILGSQQSDEDVGLTSGGRRISV